MVMKRLLVACGLPVVRYGLVKLVEEHFHGALVDEAGTASQALQRVGEADWDLVGLGLGFDGPGRLELLKAMQALRPKLAVLVFSKHSEDLVPRRTFKAGAAGYLTADSSRDKVVHALEKVMSGGRYVSPHLAETFAPDFDPHRGRPPHLALP